MIKVITHKGVIKEVTETAYEIGRKRFGFKKIDNDVNSLDETLPNTQGVVEEKVIKKRGRKPKQA